ncbi:MULTISPECIES: hypothetical protein [unclassified Photobacterium]|uniref:hypothetical protein n=1 Tax=unclassified Photobacterium TaxID=2628852 RepID=UPI000D166B72|nr:MULTISPECIES: hypothetical protein [unclassified Photobacterium]PSV27487.1 hypothetical protein C9J42_07575 [Photobacterium sp. GB-56]PSV31265.1 hypothetical protein C9J40_09470 [Photobacterium sp. GB-72]PSV34892.1 hypothetical protein C9J38_17195 [Photobacterium sp. GB-210]PSV37159.1 hypothetical protein C9J44_08015 [Photobacterium sp. GB-27]PSV44645.1 hypothetical protein C9J46_09070 [Photobacterium sp. GB-36]
MLKKAFLGIFLALLFIIVQAIFNAVSTQSAYLFTKEYPAFGSEIIKVDLNDGRIKINTIRKDKENRVISSSLFSGVFLKIQNHYYTFGVKQLNKSREVDFTFSNFYIDYLRTKEAVYISDDRGILELASGKSIYLSSLLLGQKIR